MPQSIFVFDFGSNEAAAQQARHKVDAWKQGFRLGDKMQLKFERTDSAETEESGRDPRKTARAKPTGTKPATRKGDGNKADDSGNIRLFVRLAFSDHEKLSHQRWLDRIPAEEPFKSANAQTIRTGDPEFPQTVELFDSLD